MGHYQRLGESLRFVVNTPRAHWIHVAPVVLALRVDGRVAVDLARGGLNKSGTVTLSEFEQAPCPLAANGQGLQRSREVHRR